MSAVPLLHAHLRVPDRLDAVVEAEAGDVLAVVGPNGAGKTTLVRCLAGLLPDSGDLTVDGRSWSSPHVLPRDRRVGHVVQGRDLFPHLSARENVAFGLRARGVDRRTARAR
ncbi:MAG TPA: ATP-binding cassette domain-containing protein, partial [Nocardioides sp.]